MKLLKEIKSQDYEYGRSGCVTPDTLVLKDEGDPTIYLARFWVETQGYIGSTAVEGWVVAELTDDEHVKFQQVTEDGERQDPTYRSEIDDNGLIGQVLIRDGSVLPAKEGYLVDCSDPLDDLLLASHEELAMPAHVTLGGAYGDRARANLFQREL